MACKICQHPDRTAIEATLAKEGPRAAERAHNVPKTTLLRHRDSCLAGAGAQSITPSTAAPSTPPTSSTSHWTAPAPSQPPPTSRTPVLVVTPASTRAPTFSGRSGPGRQCHTCSSPVRAEIEAMLCAGVPRWRIARDVPGAPAEDSIRRHARNCIPALITQARAEAGAHAALTIGDRVAEMVEGMEAALADIQAAAARARELYEAPAAGQCATCGHSPDADERHRMMVTTAKAAAEVAAKMAAVLTLAGKYTGELDRGRADIRDAAQWPAFTRSISRAVAGCEACSKAVETALESLEDGS